MKKRKKKEHKKKGRRRPPAPQRQHARTPVKPELLAPAGTHEAFEAAIRAGADAIYVGAGSLNARAFAKNFTTDEIASLTARAHEQGRKLFVAMNSLMKEDEIPATIKSLAAFEQAGVDALIVQDLGVWRIASRFFPDLRLHASTLMTIHNSAGVQQAEAMGFSRVVLAREMTLKEIRAVAAQTDTELEVFIHGAMCFTYSGLCMFSSFFGGKSSTRGRCVQPCRRRYEWAGRKGTFFSMDDLNGLEFVQQLSRTGINSLKIEGRLKPPHYVESVVRAYRLLIDLPEDAGEDQQKAAIKEAGELIAQSLGRPGSPGYFTSSRPPGAVTPTRAANTGQYIGKVTRAEGDSVVEITGRIMPEDGDRLRLVDTQHDTQRAFTCRGAEPLDNGSGYRLRLPDGWDARTGMLLFRTDMAGARKDGVRQKSKKPKLPAGFARTVRERARQVISELEHERPRAKSASLPAPSHKGQARRREHNVPLWLRVKSMNQLKMASDIKCTGVIIALSDGAVRSLDSRRGELFQDMEVVWSLPPIIQEEMLGRYRRLASTVIRLGYRNFEVSNIGHISLLATLRIKGGKREQKMRGNAGRRLKLYAHYTMNLLNSEAVKAARDIGIAVPQLAVETDEENARKVLAHAPTPLFYTMFSWVPLFTSRLDHSSYAHGRPVSSMRDEKFYWQKGNGANVLLPHKPFSLLKRRHELEEMGISALVIDLANWPAAREIKRGKKGRRFNLMDILKRGREFNFASKLW